MLLLIALPVVLLLFLSAIEDRLGASVQWVDSDSDAFVIGTIRSEEITLKQLNDSRSQSSHYPIPILGRARKKGLRMLLLL